MTAPTDDRRSAHATRRAGETPATRMAVATVLLRAKGGTANHDGSD